MKPTAITRSCLLVLLLIGISEADADSIGQTWTVVKTSGQVQVTGTRGGPVKARAGMHLRAPFDVATGDDGRVVVSRHGDRLTIAPDTRSTVEPPTDTGSGVITRIRQTRGSVLYHDEHRLKDSFEVDTPFLVSVVKGTTFNIHVTPDASTVVLLEGSLKVSMPDARQGLMLVPGQAAIRARDAHGITVKDQQSLSAPVGGPITVGRQGRAPARLRDDQAGHGTPIGRETLPTDAEHIPGMPLGVAVTGRGAGGRRGLDGAPSNAPGLSTTAAVSVGSIVRGGVPAASAPGGAGGVGSGSGASQNAHVPASQPGNPTGGGIPSNLPKPVLPPQAQVRLP